MKLTRVVPIEPSVILPEENDNHYVNRPSEDNPVKLEKLEMTKRAEDRFQQFKLIIYNKQTRPIPNYVSLYGIGGILLGVVSNLFTTLIPLRDAIENPEYFKDFLPIRIIGIIMAVTNNLILFRYWTNTRCIATKKHFGLSLLLFALIIAILFSVATGIWTKLFGFQLPIPFQQWIVSLVALLILSVVTWALVPKQWRRSMEFQKRFPFFVANTFYQYFGTFVFTGLGYLFLSVPDRYQWILAIMLPLVRETNILIQEKIAQKSAGGKDTSVTVASSHIVNTRYSVFLSVMVGTIANDLSSSIMLLSDFIFNLYLAIKIIWIKKMKYWGLSKYRQDEQFYSTARSSKD